MNRKTFDFKMMLAMLMFLAVLIAGIMYINPLWAEVSSLTIGRDEQAIQRDQLQKKLTELQLVQQNLNLQTEVSRETNLNAIPVGFEEDKLIKDINAIADQSKVLINGIGFSQPENVGPGEVGKVTVSTNLSADEGDLLTFLRLVESDSRKILVKSISVQNVAGEDTSIKRVNFNLSMETYFQGLNK